MKPQPIIPLRVYDDMEAAQRFLVDVFGFKQGRLDRDPNISLDERQPNLEFRS